MIRFPRARRRGQGETHPDDGGFILLESIIAISLITVIMSALGVFFVNTVASADQQRNRTSAVQLANTTVENERSRDGASLIVGRDSISVTSQFASAQATSAPVQSWLTSMDYATAFDPAAVAPSGTTAAIPTVPTAQTVGTVSYSTNQYLGYCYIPIAGSNTDCAKTDNGASVRYLRTVVAVTWTGSHCNPVSCTYITSTLISTTSDPKFLVHQPLPAAPVVANPGNQISAVGDNVSLQLTVQNNTGVPNFTWNATGLPSGLTASSTGLITNTGTLTQSGTPASVTVTVTDAFLRTDTATFTWTIKPPLLITDPGPQASTTATTVNKSLAATGGEGAPYTWSDAGSTLPPGLTLSSTGTVTGRPTTVGTYTVRVTVADKSTTRTATATFTWTVAYPPLAASNPGAQLDTVNAALTLQLTASGGSGGYVWKDAVPKTLPAGLSISSSGLISGTPTATTGTPANVTLTVTDPTAGPSFTQTVTFTWAIVAAPAIASPGTNPTTETADESVPLSYTCPNTSCTITLSGSVPGIGLSTTANRTGTVSTTTLSVSATSGTVYLTGTVSTTAVTSGNSKVYTPGLSIVDASSVSTSPAPGSWTVTVAPAVTAPDTTNFGLNKPVSGSATTTLGTPGYTYAISPKPTWLSINASTGALTGTTPNARSKIGPITVTVTDSAGVSDTDTFTWYVTDLAFATIPTQTTTKGKRYTATTGLKAASYDSGGTSPYTYEATGLPTGLSMSTAGVVTGTASTKGAFSVTVTDTDSIGAMVTTSFTWNVT